MKEKVEMHEVKKFLLSCRSPPPAIARVLYLQRCVMRAKRVRSYTFTEIKNGSFFQLQICCQSLVCGSLVQFIITIYLFVHQFSLYRNLTSASPFGSIPE